MKYVLVIDQLVLYPGSTQPEMVSDRSHLQDILLSEFRQPNWYSFISRHDDKIILPIDFNTNILIFPLSIIFQDLFAIIWAFIELIPMPMAFLNSVTAFSLSNFGFFILVGSYDSITSFFDFSAFFSGNLSSIYFLRLFIYIWLLS